MEPSLNIETLKSALPWPTRADISAQIQGKLLQDLQQLKNQLRSFQIQILQKEQKSEAKKPVEEFESLTEQIFDLRVQLQEQ